MAKNHNQDFMNFLTDLGYYQNVDPVTGDTAWFSPNNEQLNNELFGPGGAFSKKHRRQFQMSELAGLMPQILAGNLTIEDIMGGGFNTGAQGALMQILMDQQAGSQAMQDRQASLDQLQGFLSELDQGNAGLDVLKSKYLNLLQNPQMISDQEYGMLGAGMQEQAARGAQDALMQARDSMAQRGLVGSGIAQNQREQIMQEANNTALRNMRELNLQKANERQNVFNMAQTGMLNLGNIENQQNTLRGNINNLISQIYGNTNRQGLDLSGLMSSIQGNRQDIFGMQAGTNNYGDYGRNQ